MVVLESTLVGLLLLGIGVAVATKPQKTFAIRHRVAVASSGELTEFGIARYQAYGLLCTLLGLLLVIVPLFLP
ncbi:PEP-CTERM protein-sorting domain-containing protein [Haladaptatus litoreus]|uniref:PEP-CTERM protein-sorting domain-containing protein n=1 Tax=Haladaptatus litoreus TaxID=553468 RepID=A0A1N6UPX5_9EURY|nr:hypothetical protein [Haladaptatus litoreus]SIQ67705.1 PEP-CTERM protein-sorting domain-containing protein [Haladaptatus litoreus]